MSTWAVIGIITIVLGIIVSNIMLLKYSAKFKMPKTFTAPEQSDKTSVKESESAVSDAAPDAAPADKNATVAPTQQRADD